MVATATALPPGSRPPSIPAGSSSLALIMRRAGLLDDEASAQVEAYRRQHGLSALEAVLALRLADEGGLSRFLQSKLLIPSVSAEVLERLDAATVEHVPSDLAWMHDVLPVSVDEVGNMTVAMADPTNIRAVEAVAAHTGAYLVRAVAPLGPLRSALERHYGPPPPVYRGPPTPRNLPAVETSHAASAAPLSSPAFERALRDLVDADDRDGIMQVLLDFLGEGFGRVISFIHLRDQIRGRDARGKDLLLEAVTQVRIPTTGPSRFVTAIRTGEPYVGAWPNDAAIDRAFARALGGIEGDALVLPIRLRDKVPLLVFGSEPTVPVDPRMMRDLAEAVSGVLERLIFRRKHSGEYPKVG